MANRIYIIKFGAIMKICYILNYELSLNLPRGDAIHIANFVLNIKKLGHDIFFIRKNGSNELVSSDIKSYNITFSSKLKVINKIFYAFKFYKTTFSILKEEMPDIIHEREVSWRTYFNLGGMLLAWKFQIPYILEANAPILFERGIYHSYFARKLEKISEKVFFDKASKIIVVSNVLKDYLVAMNVPKEKIAVIPNGADIKMFNPTISGASITKRYNLESKRTICFSGSLDQPWQGIDEILKSAKIICSIDSTIQFLIVGNTSGQEEMLKSAPKNVIFTGNVAHSEVSYFFAAADVLVAPYKLKEEFKKVGFYNSPVKLFEYMAMGKPIITSDLGQISEVIKHEKSGLLIEPGNYKELANNILKLVENQQLVDKLGSNARVEFEKNYTWEMNAMKVIAVYEEILECRCFNSTN
jgi:glycosyltransferase involved in cell wall biosynthesis